MRELIRIRGAGVHSVHLAWLVLALIAAPAHGQEGACCQQNNLCVTTDLAGCDAVGGVFLGEGSTCAGTACPAAGTVVSDSKISQLAGGFGGTLADEGNFGGDVANLGDLDGDGVNDVAVGASFIDPTKPATGEVWILFMNADGTVKSERRIREGESGFVGPLVLSGGFGAAVAAVGDVDGDGVVDLAVGAPGEESGVAGAGKVFILALDTDGTVQAETSFSAPEVPVATGDLFGNALASLGDLDGDGTLELAVGALSTDGGGEERGAVYIVSIGARGAVQGFGAHRR